MVIQSTVRLRCKLETTRNDFHSPALAETVGAFILLLLVMPAVAYYVKWGSRLASRIQPTNALLAMMIVGLVAETLARLLVF